LPAFTLAATSANDFVQKAAVSNMYEIETSKLALRNATRDDLKAFAQQMIQDHTKAGDELKSTLSGISGPNLPTDLDATHKAALDTLSKKTGADFDAGYLAEQKTAHDDAVDLFREYSQDGGNPRLKTFAGKTLPTLVGHQQHVQQLMASNPTPTNATQSPTALQGGQNTNLEEGANSFTEAQARDRITKAGYASIEGLTKDDKGIWRGKATKDGRAVSVSLDFKGDVAAN